MNSVKLINGEVTKNNLLGLNWIVHKILFNFN